MTRQDKCPDCLNVENMILKTVTGIDLTQIDVEEYFCPTCKRYAYRKRSWMTDSQVIVEQGI